MIGDQKDRGVGCIKLLVRKQIPSGRARSEGDSPILTDANSAFSPTAYFLLASTHWFLNLR
jgi:hypothetical protein